GVAEEEQARLLERPPGIPVLVLTTRYAGEDGRPWSSATSAAAVVAR
ncbi:DNA-binding GntR family transcriptional regulator, partial [Streptacidiphilus sp. MAP12-33]